VIWGKPGALAQLLAVDQKFVTGIPAQISFEEAASLPIAALTALNGLRRCRVSEGKEVLINGGTGGVGHFAIQIAKAKGAFVTRHAARAMLNLLESLGQMIPWGTAERSWQRAIRNSMQFLMHMA